MTGSVSGIFGIDSLALFGSEAGGTDAKSALENSINYSKKAADNGAIVTLSAHMPNSQTRRSKTMGMEPMTFLTVISTNQKICPGTA